MRACQRLHCLFLNTLKCNWRFALPLNQNMSTQERAVSHMGLLKKTKTFWPLWLLFTHVSLQSIRANPLGACRATSAIYSVCVFNISTPLTCQRPHKLVNPIGFVRLLRAERHCAYGWEEESTREKEKEKTSAWWMMLMRLWQCVQRLAFSNQV